VCGIAGILHRNGRPVDVSVLDRMTDALEHRGPDARGTWIGPGIGLGHRRLSIRDLTDHGAQPFHSRCGRVVVSYNGEIYNDRALAVELTRHHGFVRTTTCDTEIIPAGWMAWGLGLLERLEGIYSFALWDKEKKLLVLARDAIGTKPLYVTDQNGTISFASEPKALVAAGTARQKLSAPDVATLLAQGYTDPDRSVLEDVEQIPPGTALILDNKGKRTHRFWYPQRTPQITSMREAVERFRHLFENVVADQLVADVPVAVLQSGGIDSSLVSLALPKFADVSLYSVRFPERSHDEGKVAGSLANMVNRPITYIDLDDSDLEADFRSVVKAVDGSLADSSTLAVYQLAREVRRRATVALSGDGADEFFGGYPTYRATALAGTVASLLPSSMWRVAARCFATNGGFASRRVGIAEAFARFAYGLSRPIPHTAWRHYLASWDQKLLYGKDLKEVGGHDPHAGYDTAFGTATGDIWDKALLADQRYYLPADMLIKVDRCSMAHGLEVRVPFLDRRVMDFAGTVPREFFVQGQTTKALLRQAAEGFGAPREVTRGRKKGFNMPMKRYLANQLRPMANHLLDKNADVLSPLCDPDGVRTMWREHREGRIDRKYVIWVLLTLAVYQEELEG
jgi:asparagine synthase (glutamine-hydrolysing)